MNVEEIKTKAGVMKKLQAFNLFREKGIKAVESMFPDMVKFVKANKEKSLREIKNELSVTTEAGN